MSVKSFVERPLPVTLSTLLLSYVDVTKLLSFVSWLVLEGIVVELGKAFTSVALSVISALRALPFIFLVVGTALTSEALKVISDDNGFELIFLVVGTLLSIYVYKLLLTPSR